MLFLERGRSVLIKVLFDKQRILQNHGYQGAPARSLPVVVIPLKSAAFFSLCITKVGIEL